MPDPTPLSLKFATGALTLKEVGEDGRIAGVASAFMVEDSDSDVIHPGAFKNSLETKGPTSPLLWQHNSSEPIGTAQYVEEQSGLMIDGRLLVDDVARAREARALAKAGALGGFSVGFMIKRAEPRGNGGLDIYEADLWETSLVTFPANPMARISSVKSALDAGEFPSIRDFERMLRCEAGFSRKQALTIIYDGFKALEHGERDASLENAAALEALKGAISDFKGAS